jgi:acetyl-CoA carboxylase carboxyl transferase subunit alpha
MPQPEGYRKAERLMKHASRFGFPIITFIDTPGASPGVQSEERGIGQAIAQSILTMLQIEVPFIAVVIGEGGSGGALAIGVADRILMLEHAYYSVISPEGCASILWKDTNKKELAASALKMQAEELLQMGIIDDIIEEPEGGAHLNQKAIFASVKDYILEKHKELITLPINGLLEQRYQKFRKMGEFSFDQEKASLVISK